MISSKSCSSAQRRKVLRSTKAVTVKFISTPSLGRLSFTTGKTSSFNTMTISRSNVAHPYHHALSSVKKWGGQVEDYLPIHSWFDETKALLADFRHRALRHHAEGIFLCERFFGV